MSYSPLYLFINLHSTFHNLFTWNTCPVSFVAQALHDERLSPYFTELSIHYAKELEWLSDKLNQCKWDLDQCSGTCLPPIIVRKNIPNLYGIALCLSNPEVMTLIEQHYLMIFNINNDHWPPFVRRKINIEFSELDLGNTPGYYSGVYKPMKT